MDTQCTACRSLTRCSSHPQLGHAKAITEFDVHKMYLIIYTIEDGLPLVAYLHSINQAVTPIDFN